MPRVDQKVLIDFENMVLNRREKEGFFRREKSMETGGGQSLFQQGAK
jgi:hypothetical protein